MSKKLSLLDNSSDSEIELTINKDYANRYDHWRNKEELQKYKDLKKEEEDSESSSESEEEINEDFDEEFFRALSLLKGKDPRIYDKNFQLFQEKEKTQKAKAAKQKPIYMKDYERNLVLERGGQFSDEDDDEKNIPEKIPTYDEEQENLKKSFKEALGGSDDSDSDAENLLQVRAKTKKEEEEDDADYVKWLKGEEKEISEDVKKDMSYLRNYWNDPKLDEGEKFLRDYILNKRYLEKGESEIPTYEDVVSGVPSDDEKTIEEQEKFEHKYNFRFEEPDEEFIKRYPRTVGDSLRRTDNRRKQKREDRAERKRKEREQRREELKRLKALKRKEIEEKFMKLKEISGQEEINFDESDIESDFDPDKHDQKMQEMFNDEYYKVEEDQKPEFPYDEELDSENWNAWAGEKIVDEEDENADDEEENDECSESQSAANPKDDFANEMINASRPKKKVKKKSLFAKIISQPKPIYDPSGKSFEEYLDEYYKLDYEDIVGDLPVRYKYRKVIPNDFGLSVDEILTADDRELNRWCSVKKTCQYRNDDEELYDVQAFRKKADNPFIKKKFLPSVYAPKDEDDSVTKSKKENNDTVDDSSVEEHDHGQSVQCQVSKNGLPKDINPDRSVLSQGQIKKSKKRKKKNDKNDVSSSLSDAGNLVQNDDTSLNESYTELACEDDDKNQNVSQSEKQSKKSKKKKRKRNLNMEVTCENSEDKNEGSDRDPNVHHSELDISTETDNKSSKRKRKNELPLTKSESDDECSDAPDDSLIQVQNSDLKNALEINSASESVSNALTKKKKKKKKRKRKRDGSNNNSTISVAAGASSKNSNYKHKKYAPEDKRLALSDDRLAAYGINPKKFKNRIIYSKK